MPAIRYVQWFSDKLRKLRKLGKWESWGKLGKLGKLGRCGHKARSKLDTGENNKRG